MSDTAVPDALPYGLRRVWITPYTDANGTILSDTSYRLPVSQTLSFSETEEFDTLNGDDKASVAIHGKGAQVDGSLESGGLPIMPWKIFTGGEVTESGVKPNRVTILRKRATAQRPYFRVDGQVISDSGGDIVCRIYRCKCNGKIQSDFKYGTFQISQADFLGTPMPGDDDDWLYEMQRHETKVSLGSTPEANPLPIPSNLTLGTVTAPTTSGGSDGSVGLTWNELPTADSYKVESSSDEETWAAVSSANGGEPTTASTTVEALEAGDVYLRVAGVFGGTTGEYSSDVKATVPAGTG